jgi:integrase
MAKKKSGRERDRHGVYDNGGGWLYIQYKGRRVALKTQDRATAARRADEYRRRIDDPTYTGETLTVAEACRTFRDFAATGGNREKPPAAATFEMYDLHFGHFVRLLGADTPVAHVAATAVDRYIATRRREAIGKLRPGKPDTRRRVQAGTVDKELGTLSQILRLGLRRGWYHLPLEKVIPRHAPNYKPLDRHLTEAQVPLLLAELRPDRAAIVAYIVSTGADWCAVWRATPEDFGPAEWSALAVPIRGSKNDTRNAEVPIVEPFGAWAALARAWLLDHGAFVPWNKTNCREALERACKRAGVPRVTARDLRRTHGKILSARGVPARLIGLQLRHTDSRMAETVYARPERLDVRWQVAQAQHLAAGDPKSPVNHAAP